MTGAAALAFAGGTGGGSGGGGGSGSVTLNNATVESYGTSDRSSKWQINSDGYVYSGKQGNLGQNYQWTADASANYAVRATLDSGFVSSGSATGSWLACSTTRDWTVTDTAVDEAPEYAYLTIEVRDAATLEVKASCTVQIIAEKV